MDAKERSIQEVFCDGRLLRIPFFQRSYTWEEANWERFNSDMQDLIGRDEKHKYFLGSLILKEDKITTEELDENVSSKFTVIDGQQRLTTLSIYLKALVNALDETPAKRRFDNLFLYNYESPTPKLNHSVNDRAAYHDIMLDGFNNLTKYKSDKVIKAYRYFQEQLKKLEPHKLQLLLRAIYNNITFVAISLNNNDDEQQIFDTINSLGVKLTIDELMKNFLYDSENEVEYNNNWKPIFDTDSAMKFWKQDDAATSQAATATNTVIYNFFFDFVRIKMWDYDLTSSDKDQFVKKNEVLETCKAFVGKYKADKQELANEIIEYAKLYQKYFDKKNLFNATPSYSCIDRIALISMVYNNAMRPYLLYVLHNVEDEAQRNDIFKFLETYMVRRAICKSDNRTSELWTEQLIRQRINTVDSLKKHIMNLDAEKSNHMPSDNEVISAIKSNDLDKNAKMVLYLWESRVNREHIHGYNYFVEKQIIPTPGAKNKTTYPPYEDVEKEAQRKRNVKTLGNYLLLNLWKKNISQEEIDREIKIVSKNDHKVFAEKKKGIQAYVENVSCMNWFKNQISWSEDDIIKRNSTLAKYVNEKFWTI